jgi:2'-5' RNA ligase
MQAIVTALDDPYRDYVENIWGELKAVFGLQAVTGSTRPHLTFHVADSYEATRIDEVLTSVAATTSPFEIETHGLGVFRGDEIVIYLHVSPNEAVREMHVRIWRDVGELATGVHPVYSAATWVPHVTLAIGDVPEAQLPAILAFLNRRDYDWRIPATNLALIPNTESATDEWRLFDFSGTPAR